MCIGLSAAYWSLSLLWWLMPCSRHRPGRLSGAAPGALEPYAWLVTAARGKNASSRVMRACIAGGVRGALRGPTSSPSPIPHHHGVPCHHLFRVYAAAAPNAVPCAGVAAARWQAGEALSYAGARRGPASRGPNTTGRVPRALCSRHRHEAVLSIGSAS